MNESEYEKLLKLCNTFGIELYRIQWLNACWEVLNAMCEKHVKSPIKTNELISLFGMVCFNNSPLNHPVDYLENIYNEVKLNNY